MLESRKKLRNISHNLRKLQYQSLSVSPSKRNRVNGPYTGSILNNRHGGKVGNKGKMGESGVGEVGVMGSKESVESVGSVGSKDVVDGIILRKDEYMIKLKRNLDEESDGSGTG